MPKGPFKYIHGERFKGTRTAAYLLTKFFVPISIFAVTNLVSFITLAVRLGSRDDPKRIISIINS